MYGYSLNEIGLIPSILSDIEHRGDVNPYIGDKLPIFVSPMTCILNRDNFNTFEESRAIPVLPRECDKPLEQRSYPSNSWHALSLSEFEEAFVTKQFANKNWEHKVLIDVANGHMKKIYDLVRKAKENYKDKLTVMIGNIACPETYAECCKAGVDYVRVGIGGGNACTTGVQTGIHASMVWLLTKIREIKKEIDHFETEDKDLLIRRNDNSIWESWQCGGFRTKIIADGGIDTIDKAIKCLALGADYIMMGKLFAQTKEACGEEKEIGCKVRWIPNPATSISLVEEETEPFKRIDIPGTGTLMRKYYGMASEQGQKDISGGVHKNAEGIETWVPVEYTLNEFLDKFEAALRSCMSYCGAYNLKEFIGKVKWEPMTECEFKSYYK